MPGFAVSICFLSLVQAALIAAPGRPSGNHLRWAHGRWWALAPAASVAIVIAVIAASPGTAGGFAWLALLAVPPLAALALWRFARGGRPVLALAVVPLFALAWADRVALLGELAALALSALACVTLGSLLAEAVPRRWLERGIYAMALLDAALVAADLLQHPNSVLAHASPGAGLPHLQSVVFGSAAMGFGDLFIAATVGALLAAERRPRRDAVMLAAVLGLAFNLLFFFVDELPATVPIALTLAILEARRRRASPPVEAGGRIARGGLPSPAPAAMPDESLV